MCAVFHGDCGVTGFVLLSRMCIVHVVGHQTQHKTYILEQSWLWIYIHTSWATSQNIVAYCSDFRCASTPRQIQATSLKVSAAHCVVDFSIHQNLWGVVSCDNFRASEAWSISTRPASRLCWGRAYIFQHTCRLWFYVSLVHVLSVWHTIGGHLQMLMKLTYIKPFGYDSAFHSLSQSTLQVTRIYISNPHVTHHIYKVQRLAYKVQRFDGACQVVVHPIVPLVAWFCLLFVVNVSCNSLCSHLFCYLFFDFFSAVWSFQN